MRPCRLCYWVVCLGLLVVASRDSRGGERKANGNSTVINGPGDLPLTLTTPKAKSGGEADVTCKGTDCPADASIPGGGPVIPEKKIISKVGAAGARGPALSIIGHDIQKIHDDRKEQGLLPGHGLAPAGATLDGVVPRTPDEVRVTEALARENETAGSQITGPEGSRFFSEAGNGFLKAGQPQAAERNFRRVLASDPTNLAAQQGLAQSLFKQGRTDEASALAKKMLQQDPDNRFAQMLAGPSAGVQRASGVADKFKKLGQDLWKGSSDEELSGGQANAGLGRTPGAMGTAPRLTAQQTADLANAAQPGGAHIIYAPLVEKGLSKSRLGDFSGALLVLSQAVDEDPRDAVAWTVRAEVDNALKSYPAAIKDAGTALDLKPVEAVSARALRARAYAELETGALQQALADVNHAIELDPRNGLAFLYRAMAEERLGMVEAAARDLETAVRLDSSLSPLAAPLRDKLGLSDGASRRAPRFDRRLIRGGITLSLLLVLLGLLGTQRGRELTKRWTTSERPATAGGEPAAVPELAPDSVVGGNYRIVRELGRGGMGVVYEGFDQTLHRRVAIKSLQRYMLGSQGDVERFLREARLVAQLKHPNVAEIYTVLMEDEPFLVFEYLDGKSLDQVLAVNKTLPIPAVRRLVVQVSAALGAAHGRDIIHRDLKPSNIMIVGDGTAKVMDFGVAHQSQTSTGLTLTTAAGTPPYMAPEQGLGSVSKASDLYALGVMVYELLCGSRPFAGPDFLEAKLQRRYEAITLRYPSLPSGLDSFFAQALEPDPTKRYSNAALFSSEFERACAGS